MKVRTPYNYKPERKPINYGVSLTEPDQSLTIKEILERSMMGLSTVPYRDSEDWEDAESYLDGDDLPEPGDFDYVDLMNLRNENRRKNREIEEAANRKEVLSSDRPDREVGKKDREVPDASHRDSDGENSK